MTDFLYRFRSLKKALDECQELEKQEIYFASFKELNDPMEGFKDIFWKGDLIVWKKLIKNYLLCLQLMIHTYNLIGHKEFITGDHIYTYRRPSELPESLRKQYENICSEFFEDKVVQKLPDWLAKNKHQIRRGELLFYLKVIHAKALNVFFPGYSSRPMEDCFPGLATLYKIAESPKNIFEAFNQAHESVLIQQDLIMKKILEAKSPPHYNDIVHENKVFIFIDFTRKYIDSLEKIMYPSSYIACFMEDCTNASVWSHYGNKHTGICLKFKKNTLESERTCISLIHKKYGMRPMEFKQVSYKNTYPSINFFKSIGRVNYPTLNECWYVDENNKTSRCVPKNEDVWREKYWKYAAKINTVKLKDWKYEKEYRLILNDMFVDHEEDDALRKLKYNFSSLEGIIFGMNTPDKEKLRIIEIIRNKCQKEKRQDFKFYQAKYSRLKEKIECVPLDLIKLE